MKKQMKSDGVPWFSFNLLAISKQDDTLSISLEVLEVLRDLEAPLQAAAPQPPDWRRV